MNRILYIIATVLVIGACKKEEKKIDPSVPLEERIPGLWNVTAINYTGALPVGGGYLPFSGEGKNVDGYFLFTNDPNQGLFEISFVAEANVGLGQPVSYNVDEKHDGNWKPINNDQAIRMWRNDTVYDWQILHNTDVKQSWKTSFVFDFGGQYDSIPVDVKATLER